MTWQPSGGAGGGGAPSGPAGGDLTGTYPDPTIAKVPSVAVVIGTRITGTTTAGKLKISADVQTATGAAGGDLSGTYPDPTVAKVPSAALVAGTGVTLATTAGKAKISSSGSSGLITAETSATGVTLIDGTQTILSVTAPNDGKIHVILAAASIKTVTAALTGGHIQFKWISLTGAGRATSTTQTTVGGHGLSAIRGNPFILVNAGTTITLTQSTAMTAGAAKVYAKIVIL